MEHTEFGVTEAGAPIDEGWFPLSPAAPPAQLEALCRLVFYYDQRLSHPTMGGMRHPLAPDPTVQAVWSSVWTGSRRILEEDGLVDHPGPLRLVVRSSEPVTAMLDWGPSWARRVRTHLRDGRLPPPDDDALCVTFEDLLVRLDTLAALVQSERMR